MPQFLSFLSQLLQSGRTIVTHDDLAALTDESCESMIGLKVLVPTGPATHVVCNACHEDHVEETLRIKVGNEVLFRLYCPDAGWVDVDAKRLRQWTLDPWNLANLLSQGLGPGNSAEVLVPGAVWRLGSVEVVGVTFSVALVREIGVPTLKQASTRLPPQRTVVICAGEATDASDGYAATLSLSKAFTFNSERFELQVSKVRSSLRSDFTGAGNVFQQRGEMWILSFGGNTVYMKDTVGMFYISRLLADPNRVVAAVDLLAARAGIDPRMASGSSGPVLDPTAREQYKRRYEDLSDRLEDAKQNNDEGLVFATEDEMDRLATELAAATGLGGKARDKSGIERVRKAVSQAVARDIQRIAKEHERLGDHLTLAVSSGRSFRYAPESNIDWLV